MNLNQLRVFAAVANHGSLTAAARALRVSQPAVSKQLAELEGALGLSLLDRLPRGVLLSEAGEALRRHATTIFAAEQAAELELAELSGLSRGALAIGASTTIGNYLLPPLLAAFRESHPQVHLSVEINNTRDVQGKVLEGQLDFGLTEGLVSTSAVDAEVVAHDEIVLISGTRGVRPKGPLASAAELVKYPILFREPGSGTRDVVEAALLSRGISINPVMSLGGTEALKNAVASGLGLAFVSKLTIELELSTRHLLVVPIRGLELRRGLQLITHKGKRLSSAAQAFVELLRGELDERAPSANTRPA
ncbi:MAG: LysR substrate-binding domain-containing protein [Polyangiaceae bacterium]|nr:LysR substrate-binding domain-containing protein [Polyangiaceae bacterium]